MQNDGPPIRMEFNPEVPLGATVTSASIHGSSVQVSAESHPQEEDAHVEFTAAPGVTDCRIAYSGGIEITPEFTTPAIGDASRNLKILSVTFVQHELHIDAYIKDAGHASLLLHTPWKPVGATGAALQQVDSATWRVQLQGGVPATDNVGKYREVRSTIQFAPSGK